jgi:hypothetical protein
MRDFVEVLARILPALKLFPEWVQLLICIWIVFSALVAAIAFFQYKPGNTMPSGQATSTELPRLAKPWPKTDDTEMDVVFARLNKIEERGTVTEAELISVIGQFFQRNVFYHIQEDPPQTAAYVFGHGERLLGHYQSFFRPRPTAYKAIGTAKTRLVKLQQILSKASGQDQFFIQTTFSSLSTKKTEFEQKLIQANLRTLDADVTVAREANETLNELREDLRTAGLQP